MLEKILSTSLQVCTNGPKQKNLAKSIFIYTFPPVNQNNLTLVALPLYIITLSARLVFATTTHLFSFTTTTLKILFCNMSGNEPLGAVMLNIFPASFHLKVKVAYSPFS
jgi:hypothetical protein